MRRLIAHVRAGISAGYADFGMRQVNHAEVARHLPRGARHFVRACLFFEKLFAAQIIE
jgi:hypothetical protein